MQVQASAGQANEESIATWTEATYQAGLDAAQRLVASYRVGEAGLKKRSAAMESFTAWLARGEGQRTLQACTPKDIVVYLTMEYLPKHQGSTTASGERCCAPSSVEQLVSHMGQCFAQMGRGDK